MNAPKKCLCLLGLALCLALAGAAAAGPAEQIKQADALYVQRADLAKAQQAAELYQQALQADPKSEEAAWKLARALYWVGNHAAKDKQVEIFDRAVKAGQQAVAINPQSLPGHFWLGVAYGVYGNAKGVLKSLSLVNPIKQEMALVIKMDPGYEAGGAYRVLGRLYFKLPGLFGGDNDLAIKNLRTAVAKGPKRYLSHIYLAEVLIKEGQEDAARKYLQMVVSGPADPGFEPEDKEWKATAQKMLKGL
ncbi:MAG: hypothetical protein C4525_06445 [Desulfarculus sp.]|nr:MAG: hypothetical protein C4525_06445 [Desulfarculus sp.]